MNLTILLLKAGDVESNPGPVNKNSCPCEKPTNQARDQIITCLSCQQIWHIECVGLKGVTKGALEKIMSWKCVLCMELPDEIKKQLASSIEQTSFKNDLQKTEDRICEELKKLNDKFTNLKDKNQTNEQPGTSYRDLTMNKLGSDLKKVTKTVQVLNDHNPILAQERAETDQRTYLVLAYKDKNIFTSGHIKKELNKYYPGVAYRLTRTTPGGSILLEFDEKEAGEEVSNNWNKTLFGGNEGIKNVTEIRSAGVIKDVHLEESIEDTEAEIISKYPGTKCEFFKRNGRFTGTVKITFKNQRALQTAIDNRIQIFNQKYILEVYKMKPRVYKCNNCQKFGHIARICRATSPKCGKCGNSHATTSCTETVENFKCCHCSQNHETGNQQCEVMKNKLEEITSRRQDV